MCSGSHLRMIFSTGLTGISVGAMPLVVMKNLAFPTTLYVSVRANIAMLESNQDTAVRDDKVCQRDRHDY